jgi:Cu-processing system permease protein
MRATTKIIKYELHDVFRSKWLIIYTLFFIVTTDLLFRFSTSGANVILNLMNIVLLFIPLISIVFGSMYLYHSREFIELLLSQPINRSSLFKGIYSGLALPLSIGFAAGIAIPFLFHGIQNQSQQSMFLMLLLCGIFLTFIFVALAFLIAVRHEDRVKGLGIAIFTWLLFAVIYDGLLLLFSFLFKAYPLEKTLILLTLLNPVDLARILLLMKFDISALMGYTGAVFQKFFGSSLGVGISLCSLIIWVFTPLWIGLRIFTKKDF